MFSLFIFNRHLVFRVKFVGVKLLYKAKKKNKKTKNKKKNKTVITSFEWYNDW